MVWLHIKANYAESKGNIATALQHLEEAEAIVAFNAEDFAYKARLLLLAQKLPEAQDVLSHLHSCLSDASNPNDRYIRRWCTAHLGLLRTNAAQFNHEARKAALIQCSPRLRRRFPLSVAAED